MAAHTDVTDKKQALKQDQKAHEAQAKADKLSENRWTTGR